MTRAARPSPAIDFVVARAHWKNTKKMQAATRRGVTRAAGATLSTPAAELAIVLTDDSAIRLLNRDWRGVDAATNVLSFPASNAKPNSGHLGDVILAFETITREARSEGKPVQSPLAHLCGHGFPQLNRHDHERDSEAEEMEQA